MLTFQPGDALVDLPYQLIQLLFGGAVVTAGGDHAAAKEKMDQLIREIDKCISYLES